MGYLTSKRLAATNHPINRRLSQVQIRWQGTDTQSALSSGLVGWHFSCWVLPPCFSVLLRTGYQIRWLQSIKELVSDKTWLNLDTKWSDIISLLWVTTGIMSIFQVSKNHSRRGLGEKQGKWTSGFIHARKYVHARASEHAWVRECVGVSSTISSFLLLLLSLCRLLESKRITTLKMSTYPKFWRRVYYH